MAKGSINVYECQACGESIVTIDKAEGVTPMFLACRANPTCGGRSVSKMYRVPQDLEPTHEWYRPSLALRLTASEWDHVSRGGLLIRPVPEACS